MITYVRLSRNFGEHNAVMAGLHHARGEYVVTMDDDMQNNPEEIAQAPFRDGAWVRHRLRSVRATGRTPGAAAGEQTARGAIACFSPQARHAFALDIPGLCTVSSAGRSSSTSGPMPYIDAIVLRLTSPNIGVSGSPITDARRSGQSNYTMAKLFALWGNALVSYSLIPLRLIGALGVFLS